MTGSFMRLLSAERGRGNSMGSLGGYVGPWMVGVLKDATRSYAPGMLAMSASLLLAALLTWGLASYTRREAAGERGRG